jgi:epoxyqueuosine reductase
MDDDALRRFDACVRAHGFFVWGAAPAGEVEEAGRYRAYLAEGRHAGMAYLARQPELRCDPRRLVPGARTVLVFLRSHAWPAPPAVRGHGRTAAYAHGHDYHASLRRDLKAVARVLAGARSRVFVDTGPVLERYWARKAGTASLGKNTCCLRRDAGSRFFIGILVTDACFPPGVPNQEDLCGSCVRCIEACPTGALRAPFVLDARRCLSYLTIEHRGAVPPPFRHALGDMVFGCDRCQDACPYNRSITVPGHPDFRPRPPLSVPSLADILAWEEPVHRALVRSSAVARRPWEGLQEAVLIAAANTGERALLERFALRPSTPRLGALAAELLGTPAGGWTIR